MPADVSPLIAVTRFDVDWERAEIPSTELLSGAPEVDVCEYWSSPDGSYAVGGARISAACVMRSTLEADERMLVTTGSVTITGDGQAEATLRAGDVIDLPASIELTYTFHEPFEDVYVLTF